MKKLLHVIQILVRTAPCAFQRTRSLSYVLVRHLVLEPFVKIVLHQVCHITKTTVIKLIWFENTTKSQCMLIKSMQKRCYMFSNGFNCFPMQMCDQLLRIRLFILHWVCNNKDHNTSKYFRIFIVILKQNVAFIKLNRY